MFSALLMWRRLTGAILIAVATLTTSSIANPHLIIRDDWLKVFTVYILTGIGILVEIAHRIGRGFVEVRSQDRQGDSA